MQNYSFDCCRYIDLCLCAVSDIKFCITEFYTFFSGTSYCSCFFSSTTNLPNKGVLTILSYFQVRDLESLIRPPFFLAVSMRFKEMIAIPFQLRRSFFLGLTLRLELIRLPGVHSQIHFLTLPATLFGSRKD